MVHVQWRASSPGGKHLNDEDATIGGLTRRLDHGEAPKGPERVALVSLERDGGQRRASRRAHLTLPSACANVVVRESVTPTLLRRTQGGSAASATPASWQP